MMKTISIDWDSIGAIQKQIRVLRARKRELEKCHGGEKPNNGHGQKFAACMKIWEHDISSLYENRGLDTNRSFYVYAHLNPSEPIDVARAVGAFAATIGLPLMPFYIGKGCKARDSITRRNETHNKVVQKLIATNKTLEVKRILEKLTESEALQAEAKLIDIFALIPNGGLLCNLDEGFSRIERRTMYRDSLRVLAKTADDYQRIHIELYGNKNYPSKK